MVNNVDIPEWQWRNPILDAIGLLFSKENDLYGFGHACRVEKIAQERLSLVNIETEKPEQIAIRSAALLHDVGFSRRASSWSLEGIEHIVEGIEIARDVLSSIPYFQTNPNMVSFVISLIEHHDTTTYSYPSPTRLGTPIKPLSVEPPFTTALHILREADAITHAQPDSVNIAVSEWLESNIPILPPKNSPQATTWQWMETIHSNLRLLGRRTLIDAFTEVGKQEAVKSYKSLEKRIEDMCQEAKAEYVSELFSPQQYNSAQARLSNRNIQLQLVSHQGWQRLVSTLRQTTLKYDKQLLPYQTAVFNSRVVSLDEVTPMALYVIKNRLDETIELYDAMMVTYGLSLFDLAGLLTFCYNDLERQTIAPPLIEPYNESHTEAIQKGNIVGLVDGLHRCYSARQLGLEKVRVVDVSETSYPLVPLPARWDLVRIFDQPPPHDQKRFYRYQALEEFPLPSFSFTTPVNERTYQYFFFRDLSNLGSKGRRDFHEYDEKRAN